VLSKTGKERECTIAEVFMDQVQIHYDGFDSRHDEWLPKDSTRIVTVVKTTGDHGCTGLELPSQEASTMGSLPAARGARASSSPTQEEILGDEGVAQDRDLDHDLAEIDLMLSNNHESGEDRGGGTAPGASDGEPDYSESFDSFEDDFEEEGSSSDGQ
jgi:hypothetical protein